MLAQNNEDLRPGIAGLAVRPCGFSSKDLKKPQGWKASLGLQIPDELFLG
jgi:hypothetical protein